MSVESDAKPVLDEEIHLGEGREYVLGCPWCQAEWSYIHHTHVDVWWRDGEDSATGTHVASDDHHGLTVGRTMEGNPSRRRDGLAIEMWCELCEAASRLTIAQHKGQTIVCFRVVGKGKERS